MLGIALLVTFAISIGGIVQRNHITIGLVILNWALILDALGIVVIGTFVWIYTLEERNNYHAVFSQQSAQYQVAIQDMVRAVNFLLMMTDSCSSSNAAVISTPPISSRSGAVYAQVKQHQINLTTLASGQSRILLTQH